MRWLAGAIFLAALPAVSADFEAQRRQQVEDARAAVRQGWAPYSNLIETIEVGYRCNVVDQTSANVAVMQVQLFMRNQAIEAGLIGDRTLDIQGFTESAVSAGIKKVDAGVCAQVTPEWRGQVRQTVRSLMP